MDCIYIKVDMLTNILWSDRIENGFQIENENCFQFFYA